MIPFNFDYYKVYNLKDAVDLFMKLDKENKKPIYYAGGTEFISMAQVNNRYTKAIIDIKSIPECHEHILNKGKLIIGAAISLKDIALKNYFPLLSATVRRIADHTVQGKITLGGNLAGTIIYKEAILPLMVVNAKVLIMGRQGLRTERIMDLFNEKLRLSKEELIVQVVIEEKYLDLPYLHSKRTKNEKIDYPLISLVALVDNRKKRMALSGLCEFPFRLRFLEEFLNDGSLSRSEKVEKFIKNIPYEILEDLAGSREYRKFLLHNMLYKTLEDFQEVIKW